MNPAKTEFAKGMKEESGEHPDVIKGVRSVAEKLVMAHLKKDPLYYTHLSAMERRQK